MIIFMKLYKLHTKQQEENECGIACINTILKYHNYILSYSNIRKSFQIKQDGLSIKDIICFFSSMDIESKIYKPDNLVFNLKEIDKKQFPCIALIQKDNINHYIVLHKMLKGRYVYSDPAKDTFTITNNSLFLKNVSYIISFDIKKLRFRELVDKINESYFVKLVYTKRRELIAILLKNMLASLFMVFSSLKFGLFVDTIGYKNLTFNRLIWRYSIIFFFVGYLEKKLLYVVKKKLIYQTKQISEDINIFLFEKVISEYKNIKLNKVGDIFSRIITFIESVSSVIENYLYFFGDLLIVLAFSIWMLNVNFLLSIIVIFSVLLNILIIYKTYIFVYIASYNSFNDYSEYYGKSIEVLDNLEKISYSFSQKYHLNNVKSALYQSKNSEKHLKDIFNNISLIRSLITMFTSLLIIIIGVNFVHYKIIKMGTLTTFIMISSLLQNVGDRFIDVYLNTQSTMVSYERVVQIVDTDMYFQKKTDLLLDIDNINTIIFENLSVFYSCNIINEVSLCITNKNNIIYGESGIGKSTFAKIIALIDDNYTGKYKINGIVVNQNNRDYFKQYAVYIDNNPVIFTGTIRENICQGKKILENHLKEICRKTKILDFIEDQKYGFDTMLYSNHCTLSTGQKQRMELAKAILLEPKVLILDEALSNLDEITRDEIIENLNTFPFMKIYITHDELKIKNCDYFEIKNKKIIKRKINEK